MLEIFLPKEIARDQSKNAQIPSGKSRANLLSRAHELTARDRSCIAALRWVGQEITPYFCFPAIKGTEQF